MGNSLIGIFLHALRTPFGSALFASTLCAAGMLRLSAVRPRVRKPSANTNFSLKTNLKSGRAPRSAGIRLSPGEWNRLPANDFTNSRKIKGLSFASERVLLSGMSAFAVTTLVLILTGSLAIAFPFACLSSVVAWVYLGNRESEKKKVILQAWPEVVDHLISGIQAGLSLSEAMVSLSSRGPEIIRKDFEDFKKELQDNGDFTKSVERLKNRFHSQSSDQILEAILMAKLLGGSELLEILRTLGDFLRQDLALRKEIDIKHGWIRNSAHLSSAAPWFLLLLLSSQPGTVDSFSQPSGVLILILGLFMTLVAYLWMGKLSRLPEAPRVFNNFIARADHGDPPL